MNAVKESNGNVSVRPLCQALGLPRASFYRWRSPRHTGGENTSRTGPQPLARRTPTGARHLGQRPFRRPGADASLRHAARRGGPITARRERCTASFRTIGRCGSDGTSCDTLPFSKPELLAHRSQPGLVLGHHQTARTRQVDLLLPLRHPRHLQPLRPSDGWWLQGRAPPSPSG